jgi:hypothetical protein
MAKAIDYDLTKEFKVNDLIFHKEFDDTGRVIEVGVTRDNEKKMVVEFQKVGRKRLIMGLDLKKLE